MPRSWNDSWLQKSLKTLQRGHWDLPDISSECFLHWFFQGAFPSSFQKKRNCSSCQPRSMFHQTLWHSSAQWHRAPGFGGLHCAPELGIWIAAGNAIEAHNLLNSRHQGKARRPQHKWHRWGKDKICHPSLTSSTLTHLFWTQQQLFPFTTVPTPVEQKSPPIPYKRTKETQVFPNWTTCQELKGHLYEPTHYCYKLAKSNKSAAYVWCYTVSWVRQEKSKTVLHPL